MGEPQIFFNDYLKSRKLGGHFVYAMPSITTNSLLTASILLEVRTNQGPSRQVSKGTDLLKRLYGSPDEITRDVEILSDARVRLTKFVQVQNEITCSMSGQHSFETGSVKTKFQPRAKKHI